MLFSYQTGTQNTELRQGYSEIMIKRDKARPLLSTDKNMLAVLHTKYRTPPLDRELLLLPYQLPLQLYPQSSLASQERRFTEISNHRIFPNF